MINFSGYKAILWDFDGVLMDSMPVRDEGFKRVLAQYPAAQVDELMVYHRLNGGLSRYVKFRYFFEQIRHETIRADQVNALSAEFSKVMMALLIDATLLISDSIGFVKKYADKVPMHIVSGSDGTELREICRQLGLDVHFKSIHGSPTPKNQLVAELMQEYRYAPADIILIGDSINDREAAQKNAIAFAAYNNPWLKAAGQPYIETFTLCTV